MLPTDIYSDDFAIVLIFGRTINTRGLWHVDLFLQMQFLEFLLVTTLGGMKVLQICLRVKEPL